MQNKAYPVSKQPEILVQTFQVGRTMVVVMMKVTTVNLIISIPVAPCELTE